MVESIIETGLRDKVVLVTGAAAGIGLAHGPGLCS
jgi:NADP-dependent 3-hydroxy acid dehydrogenase YdfG